MPAEGSADWGGYPFCHAEAAHESKVRPAHMIWRGWGDSPTVTYPMDVIKVRMRTEMDGFGANAH